MSMISSALASHSPSKSFPNIFLLFSDVLPRSVRLSSPSISASAKSRNSERAVGIFLPTKSAHTGISRPPRSTSTKRRILAGRPSTKSASIAARTLRPVWSTSSQRITLFLSMENPRSLAHASGTKKPLTRSSRYMPISMPAVSGLTPYELSSSPQMRRAMISPRRLIPTRQRLSAPLFFSTISWESRVSVRRIAAASINSRSSFIYKNPFFDKKMPAYRIRRLISNRGTNHPMESQVQNQLCGIPYRIFKVQSYRLSVYHKRGAK